MIQERNWVIVDGLNCEVEEVSHYKGNVSMITMKELPLLVTCDVALVDPSDLLVNVYLLLKYRCLVFYL